MVETASPRHFAGCPLESADPKEITQLLACFLFDLAETAQQTHPLQH